MSHYTYANTSVIWAYPGTKWPKEISDLAIKESFLFNLQKARDWLANHGNDLATYGDAQHSVKQADIYLADAVGWASYGDPPPSVPERSKDPRHPYWEQVDAKYHDAATHYRVWIQCLLDPAQCKDHWDRDFIANLRLDYYAMLAWASV